MGCLSRNLSLCLCTFIHFCANIQIAKQHSRYMLFVKNFERLLLLDLDLTWLRMFFCNLHSKWQLFVHSRQTGLVINMLEVAGNLNRWLYLLMEFICRILLRRFGTPHGTLVHAKLQSKRSPSICPYRWQSISQAMTLTITDIDLESELFWMKYLDGCFCILQHVRASSWMEFSKPHSIKSWSLASLPLEKETCHILSQQLSFYIFATVLIVHRLPYYLTTWQKQYIFVANRFPEVAQHKCISLFSGIGGLELGLAAPTTQLDFGQIWVGTMLKSWHCWICKNFFVAVCCGFTQCQGFARRWHSSWPQHTWFL